MQDLRQAIAKNQPIAPLLDGCIRPPKQSSNPLISWAKAIFGEEKLKEYVTDAIKDNLFNYIKENQAPLQLLNSPEGRKYLHNQLDALLDYLTSTKFSSTQKIYKCPSCHVSFSGKCACCPACKTAFKW